MSGYDSLTVMPVSHKLRICLAVPDFHEVELFRRRHPPHALASVRSLIPDEQRGPGRLDAGGEAYHPTQLREPEVAP